MRELFENQLGTNMLPSVQGRGQFSERERLHAKYGCRMDQRKSNKKVQMNLTSFKHVYESSEI